MATKLLLSLAALLLFQASPGRAQQCTSQDGNLMSPGQVLPHPDDGCLSQVCRCASVDRCGLVIETRMMKIHVNETKQKAEGQLPEVSMQWMECHCNNHRPGSAEMDFLCVSPKHMGRDISAKVIGCLDYEGRLLMPGQKVSIRNSRKEALICQCSSLGHYVNCLPEDDPGDSCLDTVQKIRVPLKQTYYRTERNSRGLPIRLRCTCVRSDQDTSCTLV